VKYLLAFLLFSTPAYALDMREMLDWIGENSEYETNIPPPVIRTVSGEDLTAIMYGRLPGPNEVFLSIDAIYFNETEEIWVRDGIEGAAYEATILHELVHHAQIYSDMKWECLGEKEGDAYALADKYAIEVLNDPSLVMNPLVVMMVSQCQRH